MFKLKSLALVFCSLILAFMVAGCNPDLDPQSVSVDQLAEPVAGEEIVVFETNQGVIKARIFKDAVPETYKNFVYHVEEDNYDGTLFHRVIENFMIQGGDIDNMNGRGGYSYKGKDTTIDEEFHNDLSHHRGALSMAKTMFPSTTGSQFFVVQHDQNARHLDGQHSVFGQVFEGMDVVDAIVAVEADGNDKPLEDVVLEDVYLEVYQP